MQQFRKIAAISFLSIFSMYLLHQVLPHVHHEHGSAEHISITETKAEHSHDHDHHHHDDDDDSSEGFDLLGFLFGTHAHTVQVDNILVAKSISKQQVSVKVVVADVAYEIKISEREPEEQILWQHPPDPTKSPHLTSVSLRGPPSLG
ncbi:hypothetical protein [Ekhidna sp.]|uniref:hypothetical protein n=1 Tax=Ekhidna sp. TaxID=2608089 RepID=UPI00329694CA